jgi:CBS domain-containing protein
MFEHRASRLASSAVAHHMSPIPSGGSASTLRVPRIDATASIAEAARLLIRQEVASVAVVDRGNQLVGLFTRDDATRALADLAEGEITDSWKLR